MDVVVAKFEKHQSNIFQEMFDFVIFLCIKTINFSMSSVFEQRLEYLWNEGRYFRNDYSSL